MSKLTEEQFEAYLKQIRELVEGPLEEMQPEIEVTNKFPRGSSTIWRSRTTCTASRCPRSTADGICRSSTSSGLQEEFSRRPGPACACTCTTLPT